MDKRRKSLFLSKNNFKTYNILGGRMDKISAFKEFVKKNPSLIKYIKNNEMTWQKFYEIYDLYGEEKQFWVDYIEEKEEVRKSESSTTFNDFIGLIKKLDLDSLQEGISSIQRVVGVLSDLTLKKNSEVSVNEYKPRPLYKHFDD